ncbi:MAG: hypothetical protein E7773_09930 [Sphingomonas sp.]|uniref:hypothetical protein n=1 Tax=Sphingomonas sp. TaxID=28214 RepID=UPI00120CA304|nr:hypothetical protein [Sphingomonas sp.]THD36224.1 MAG: hypothetical protein E7773_09930 [Sphingomonas sp.]
MKDHALLIPLALLIGAAPAPVKTYTCTADGSARAFRVELGAGDYRTFDPGTGAWGANACAKAADCTYKGNVFTAAFGPNVFLFNRATARYTLADIFGDVTDRGKCVPG